MNIFFGVLIGIFSLLFLVTAHEFGHFLMARKNGVTVKEFGIGFPPRAIAWTRNKDGKWQRIPKSDWDKKQKSLIFSINWLPIGGFCSMDGESDADTRKGTFGAASFWGKTKILFGGVLVNWLIAALIFTILAWIGMPQFLANQCRIDADARISVEQPVTIARVMENSPAAAAGFEEGDQILRVEGDEVALGDEINEKNRQLAGQSVSYLISRNGEELTLTATLNPADSEYLLGVAMQSSQSYVHSTWSAPLVGIGTTAQLTGETFRSLGDMLVNLVTGVARQISFDPSVREAGQQAIGAAGDSVSGPIGIVGHLFPGMVDSGFADLLFLVGLISVSLACMNVLPIPALDGGRWFLIAIYRLRGKKLEKATEEKIVSRAMYVLLILIVLITILDIVRFF